MCNMKETLRMKGAENLVLALFEYCLSFASIQNALCRKQYVTVTVQMGQ